MYDVPSYLGVGESAVDEHLRSYDHGAGHLLESARKADRLPVAQGEVTRFRMTRGRAASTLSRKSMPIRSSERLDRVMSCFRERGMMRPVVRLRPLANLKNG
jgi:RNA-splicing ligase RtcB